MRYGIYNVDIIAHQINGDAIVFEQLVQAKHKEISYAESV